MASWTKCARIAVIASCAWAAGCSLDWDALDPALATDAVTVDGSDGSVSCPTGFGNCDGLASNGCEHDVTNDLANCGACGNVCTATNATPACNAGVCVPVCNAGFGDCDGLPANGCETSFAGDARNCGTCGHRCTGQMHTCVSGMCQ